MQFFDERYCTCNAIVDLLPGILPVMNLGSDTPFVADRDLVEPVPSSEIREIVRGGGVW